MTSEQLAEKDKRLFEMQNAAIDLTKQLEVAEEENRALREAINTIKDFPFWRFDGDHWIQQSSVLTIAREVLEKHPQGRSEKGKT